MTFILISVPIETTMMIVISVGIVALLIAALFVVFCAAHQFRRKDSTMYVITCHAPMLLHVSVLLGESEQTPHS